MIYTILIIIRVRNNTFTFAPLIIEFIYRIIYLLIVDTQVRTDTIHCLVHTVRGRSLNRHYRRFLYVDTDIIDGKIVTIGRGTLVRDTQTIRRIGGVCFELHREHDLVPFGAFHLGCFSYFCYRIDTELTRSECSQRMFFPLVINTCYHKIHVRGTLARTGTGSIAQIGREIHGRTRAEIGIHLQVEHLSGVLRSVAIEHIAFLGIIGFVVG